MNNTKNLSISSPGKIILCGEHAVVYGKKALACSIDLRTNIHVNKVINSNENLFKICFNDLNKIISLNENDFLNLKIQYSSEKNIENLITRLKNTNQNEDQLNAIFLLILLLDEKICFNDLNNYELEINTNLPIGAGLGSSASLSSCLASVFLILTNCIVLNKDLKFTNEQLHLINEYTYNIEKLFHGRPSGIDNSVVLNGNYILFKNWKIFDKFESKMDLNILIINSNLPKQTREQVAKVKQLKENFTGIGESLINTIDLIADEFISCLKETNNVGILNELIRMNQGLLYSLDISNYKLNTIVNVSNKFNFPCKITGAGGGGCLFALISSTDQNYEAFLKELDQIENIIYFKSILGCEGIRIENFETLFK
jgi:mevalonate kinase